MRRHLFILLIICASITFSGFIDFIEIDPVFIVNDTHFYMGYYDYLLPPGGRMGGYGYTTSGLDVFVKDSLFSNLYILKKSKGSLTSIVFVKELLLKEKREALVKELIEEAENSSFKHGRDIVYTIYLSRIVEHIRKEIDE